MESTSQPRLMDIHRAFSTTHLGQALGEQVRYERYKPHDVSNQRWIELLGADVGNLSHLPLTYGLTRSFVNQLNQHQPGFIDTPEESVLHTAALIHDWAEAIVGDITYSDKTEEDENEERVQLFSILEKIEDIDPEIREFINRAMEEVLVKSDTKLSHMFNTVERVGYLRTALRAGKHVIDQTAPDCVEGFKWIVADVFGNHPSELIERASKYVPVKNYLTAVQEDILNVFSIVEPYVFDYYAVEQREIKRDLFYQAQARFISWVFEGPSPGH